LRNNYGKKLIEKKCEPQVKEKMWYKILSVDRGLC